MLKIGAAIVVVLIAAVLLFAATRPDSFRVMRTTSIKAPPERIFPLINEFNRWSAWSPYEKKDPAMKRAYAGAAAGKGAAYEWDGNKEVGHGRMEILETTPSKVVIKLDFIAPFEAHNTAEFIAVPQGDGSNVTWAMYGPSPYFAKVMHTVIDMDKMIGRDFEAGLQSLKAVAEK